MKSIYFCFLLLLVGAFNKQVLAVKFKHVRRGAATAAEEESVPHGGGGGLILRKLRSKDSSSSSRSRRSSSSRSKSSKSSKSSRDGGTIKFFTVANGEQEVPEVRTDTEAELDLYFDEYFTKVEFDLDVFDGDDIILAHLHCALAGTNGPVVALLFEDQGGDNVDGSLEDGTLRNSDILPQTCGDIEVNNIASLYEAVLQRQIYLNVHSEEFPDGVVRGQVFP